MTMAYSPSVACCDLYKSTIHYPDLYIMIMVKTTVYKSFV